MHIQAKGEQHHRWTSHMSVKCLTALATNYKEIPDLCVYIYLTAKTSTKMCTCHLVIVTYNGLTHTHTSPEMVAKTINYLFK